MLGVLLAGRAAGGPAPFDPGQPAWTELRFEASKFFVTADAKVEARLRPAAEIAGELLDTPSGEPVPAGDQVLEMLYTARGLGKASVTTLWADPLTGAALQRRGLDTSGDLRERTYRFADIGGYHYTRRPADARERKLPAEQWSNRSEGLRAYPAEAIGKPVTENTALLWLAAAANLHQPGERIELLAFARRHVNRVVMELGARRPERVDYTLRRGGTSERRRGEVNALVLHIRGKPLGIEPDGRDDFELLGLRGDLELLLDPDGRIPLQLRGNVKIAGTVTIRLREAVLPTRLPENAHPH